MKKLNLDGKTYEVYEEELRHYDGYLFKGEVVQHAPIDTNVVGYIVEGDECYGVCKNSLRKLIPAAYGALVLSAISVIGLGVFVFSQDYQVSPVHLSVDGGGDGSGELDDGMEGSRKFSYSRYATYDGEYISLLYNTSYSGAEVSVLVDGVQTEYIPLDEAYNIPLSISLDNEGVVEGQLLLKHGNNVEEYPLTIERLLDIEQVQLAQGTSYDRDFAYNRVVSDVVEAGHYEEPEEVTGDTGNLELSSATDNGVRIDFENFGVISNKSQQELEAESGYTGEVYNSAVDVLNQ